MHLIESAKNLITKETVNIPKEVYANNYKDPIFLSNEFWIKKRRKRRKRGKCLTGTININKQDV